MARCQIPTVSVGESYYCKTTSVTDVPGRVSEMLLLYGCVVTVSPESVIVLMTMLSGIFGRFERSSVTPSESFTTQWIKRTEPIGVSGQLGITANGTTFKLFEEVVATSFPIKSWLSAVTR